ncbi:putative NTP pyrophosphohydrolase mutT motif [Alphaentomopoxvirus acuprea]|uniref:Putative NTP pyrophosphohydrolase mutT motif n=1 Tax=Alphaentomopoxvirus acuprea TaxID=62099 RepID=W6JIW8_9POXV|nr:putative NTP pyrophosphohydrolase mutT motif [Anomala cuprea entomopoxvirus]BAO49507.1 putative NTP pyrophosphohydrolase mutT motif [Anomala cuprea entomopoxvirus]
MERYILETYSERRSITIKHFDEFNISNYNNTNNASFNIVFITSDNKILIAERKYSYYFDCLYSICKLNNISTSTLRNFINIFSKLNCIEKYNIINKINYNKRYEIILKFIKENFNDDIKTIYMKKNINKLDTILFNNPVPLDIIKKSYYITKITGKQDNINILPYYNLSNIKKTNKTLILPGGRKKGNESLFNIIKREVKEEINIKIEDIDISKTYYSETEIFDKIIYKTFIDITFIATLKYSSKEILNLFIPNIEIKNISFYNLKFINYKKLLFLVQYILIM